MAAYIPSSWAATRLGPNAEPLRQAAAAALQRAHTLAANAQTAGGLSTNEAYGGVIGKQQFQQFAEVVQAMDLPGVSIRRPAGGRSHLVVVGSTAVFIWRYGRDGKTSRETARLRTPVSTLKHELLKGDRGAIPHQLTIDDPGVTDVAGVAGAPDSPGPEGAGPQGDPYAEAERDLVDALTEHGHVITIGYASIPATGICGAGWGDLQLLEATTGRVLWTNWEDLSVCEGATAMPPRLAATTVYTQPHTEGTRTKSLERTTAAQTAVPTGRFVAAAKADDDFDLPARPVGSPPVNPTSDPLPHEGRSNASGTPRRA